MAVKTPLRVLRALAVGLALYLYSRLGLWRVQPPGVAYLQGAIVLALYGWWAWKAVRGQGLPRSPVALPLAALVGAVVLSTLFSRDPRLSSTGVFEVFVPVLFFFLFCELLLAGWSAETFVDSLLLLATLLIAQGLRNAADWYWGWWALRVPEYPVFPVSFRLFGVADHPNLFASLLTLALPFAVVRLAQSRRLWPRLAYALWLAGADAVLFWTHSRGGWVGAGAAVAIMVGWLLFERRPQQLSDLAGWVRKGWRIGLVVAVYLGLFAAMFAFDARASQSGYSTSGGSVSNLASRPLFWSAAWSAFLAHPLTGSGPLTYPFAFVSRLDTVREWVSPHAHNLFLHVLAEEGILGLAALGWVFAAGALALARGWRSASAEGPSEGDRSSLLACVGAGLAGCCLVHAQADIPFWLPANALLVVMLLAVGLQAAGALRPGRQGLSRRRLLLFVAPLALVYVVGRQTAANATLLRGGDAASAGDWREAAQALDEVVAADPRFVFYQAQRGYAYGVLADPLTEGGDPAALAPALESYGVALAAWPEHVPNLLNTAWLEDEAGSGDEAERLLAAAVEHGHDWALPALLLGERYAAQGRAAEADAAFAAAFAAEPQAREVAACRQSDACREAAGRIATKPTVVAEAHERAQELLAAGRPADALAALQAVPVASADPLPWLDRTDACLALGRQAQARYTLTMATVLGADGAAWRAHYALSRAAYRLQQGRTDNAIVDLERAARPQVESDAYNIAVYDRTALPGLLLPGLAMLQRTTDDLAVYRELARLYDQEGRAADAAWAEAQARSLAALLGEATNGG